MKLSLSKTTFGMTLTLAPRSQSAWSKFWGPMEHEIVGEPGSDFFCRGAFRIAALHSSVSCTVSVERVIGFLLLRMSLRYLAYVGTYSASSRGTCIYMSLITSTNLLNCLSERDCFLCLLGKGRVVVS